MCIFKQVFYEECAHQRSHWTNICDDRNRYTADDCPDLDVAFYAVCKLPGSCKRCHDLITIDEIEARTQRVALTRIRNDVVYKIGLAYVHGDFLVRNRRYLEYEIYRQHALNELGEILPRLAPARSKTWTTRRTCRFFLNNLRS